MAGFYTARDRIMPSLLWPSITPPFTPSEFAALQELNQAISVNMQGNPDLIGGLLDAQSNALLEASREVIASASVEDQVDFFVKEVARYNGNPDGTISDYTHLANYASLLSEEAQEVLSQTEETEVYFTENSAELVAEINANKAELEPANVRQPVIQDMGGF